MAKTINKKEETEEEVIAAITKSLGLKSVFKVRSIHNINHRPHQYTVGPRHVAHAADHYSGILGEATVKAIKCAHPGCTVSHEEHVWDKVIFLQLTRDTTEAKATAALLKIKKKLVNASIDGIAFVESPEKFKMTKK